MLSNSTVHTLARFTKRYILIKFADITSNDRLLIWYSVKLLNYFKFQKWCILFTLIYGSPFVTIALSVTARTRSCDCPSQWCNPDEYEWMASVHINMTTTKRIKTMRISMAYTLSRLCTSFRTASVIDRDPDHRYLLTPECHRPSGTNCRIRWGVPRPSSPLVYMM